MWKWLHPYANPEVSYHFTGRLIPWLSALTVLFLSIGIIWALAFAPADYQQGDSFRIFYIAIYGYLFWYGNSRIYILSVAV